MKLVILIKSLLSELHITLSYVPVIWVENLSTISLAANPPLHARTKYIELDYHFVREQIVAHKFKLQHVPSADQIADLLTKSLSYQFFTRLRQYSRRSN